MKKYSFKKIDAFAARNSSGNPAGYIRLNSLSDMSEAEMLQVAKEMAGFVNEVGYIAPARDSFDLRYYSAEREVDFCGHATIAILYDLFKNDEKLIELESVNIRIKHAELTVQNRIKSENAVFIQSPAPQKTEKVPTRKEIAEGFRVEEKEISTELPVSLINAGLNTLIVPVVSLDSILNIIPDLNELKSFCLDNGIDIIEVFTKETSGEQSNFRTRVFAPTFGYLEDPATGSGNSAFGYYLLQNNLWPEDSDTLVIEQNGEREKFNVIKLQKQSGVDGQMRVWFGGGAITRIEGEYFLHI